jgi:hypothetical protein
LIIHGQKKDKKKEWFEAFYLLIVFMALSAVACLEFAG